MAKFVPSALTSDPAERERFLDVLRATGSVVAAARAVGVDTTTAQRLRRSNDAFAAAWTAVTGDRRAAALEAALIDRLTHGVERYKFHTGGSVEIFVDYDDRLALEVLAVLRPARFGKTAGAPAPRRKLMTRAEFIAAVRAQPRLPPLPPEAADS